MSDPTASIKQLSTGLCPWLQQALDTLENVHGAKRLGHAWLLAGPAGIGKINLALVFANRLLRGRSGSAAPEALEPAVAGAAMQTRHTPQDRHADLHWLFCEGTRKTIGIQQVRDVIESLERSSYQGGAKVVIVEVAEALTTAASNALLKTLEEPTPDTYLLIVSHQPGRIASTIRSRCQILPLASPSIEAMRQWLTPIESDLESLDLAGRAPFEVVKLTNQKQTISINDIEQQFKLLCDEKANPMTLADEWLKLDLELVLEWLALRVRRAIRSRMAPQSSNPVANSGNGHLPNDLPTLTLRRMFAQFEAVERLREQLGTGINVELATAALLAGFQADREGH